MRKIIILFIIASLFPWRVLLAQMTDGGNFMIGSSFGLSSAQSRITQNDTGGEAEGEGPSSTLFCISPKVGYFLVDNLALGIGLDYTFNEVNQPNKNRTKDSDLLFGPFARYYVPFSDDMAIFLEGNFGFGNSSDIMDVDGVSQNISTNIFAIGAGPGLTVFSSDAIGISAIFKYNYARSDFDTTVGGVQRRTITKTNQFNFSVGINFYFTAIRSAGSGSGGARLY